MSCLRDVDVLITGLGAVTGAGDDERFRQRWLAGESAVRPLEGADEGLPPGYGARLDFSRKELRHLPGGKALRPGTMTPYTQIAVGATGRALRDSALPDPATLSPEEAERRGICIGSYTNFPELLKHYRLVHAMGSLEAYKKDGSYVIDDSRVPAGMKGFTSFDFLKLMNNMPAAHATIQAGARGPANTYLGHATAGLQALRRAKRMIELDLADQVVAGGTGPGLSEGTLFVHKGYDMLAAEGIDPASAARPLDRDASGLVPGDGGAAVVIETAEVAAKRGATPIARLVSVQDRFVVPTTPRGPMASPAGIVRLLQDTLRAAQWTPQDVDYIAANGSGLPSLDRLEAAAIAEVFGAALGEIALAVHTGVVGYCEAAHSCLGLVGALQSMRDGQLAPQVNLEHGWDDLAAAPRLRKATSRDVRRAIVIGLAPEGSLAAVAIERV